MVNPNAIKPHMPVVASDGGQFAVVDHLEAKDCIKLAKDSSGVHHYIPVSWVTFVDTQVHVDRLAERAVSDWSTSPDPADEDPLHVERVRSQQG
jgi:hypothetical protein